MFVNIDPYTKFIRIWLLSIFLLVIIIIIVGGLTRLTDSGLSITEWELFKGVLPPLDVEKWNFYFNEYKKIPEFKSINYNMTLDEFKVIYYWEYAHRLIARLIGLVSILPIAIIFLKYKVKLSKDLKYLMPPPKATLIVELKSCEAISFVLYRLSTWEKKAAGVA